jgi:hypothetical protein
LKVIPLTEASSFVASYISEIFLLFWEKLKHSCCLYSVRAFYVHSNQHVPGFITQAEQLKAKGVDEILLISGTFPAYVCLSVFFFFAYFFIVKCLKLKTKAKS